MAVTNLTKGVFTILGAGAVLGLGYAGKSGIIGDRIIDLLKQHNPEKRLLTRNSPTYSKRGKEAWLKYREANKNKTRDAGALGDGKPESDIKNNENAPTSFIDACQTNSEARVSSTSNKLYQQVLEGCTGNTSVSIKELIRESGRRTLDEKHDFKKSNTSGGKPLLNKYLTANKDKPEDALKLTGGNKELDNSVEKLQEALVDDFVKKCTELSKIQVDNTEDPNYKNAVAYCSEDIKAEDLVKESGKKMIDINYLKTEEGKKTALAKEIGQRYITKNQSKANGQDEGKVAGGDRSPSKLEEIPDDFGENCKKYRKVNAKSDQDLVVEQVSNYCAVPETRKDHIEEDK